MHTDPRFNEMAAHLPAQRAFGWFSYFGTRSGGRGLVR
jgi:hypothetical protein